LPDEKPLMMFVVTSLWIKIGIRNKNKNHRHSSTTDALHLRLLAPAGPSGPRSSKGQQILGYYGICSISGGGVYSPKVIARSTCVLQNSVFLFYHIRVSAIFILDSLFLLLVEVTSSNVIRWKNCSNKLFCAVFLLESDKKTACSNLFKILFMIHMSGYYLQYCSKISLLPHFCSQQCCTHCHHSSFTMNVNPGMVVLFAPKILAICKRIIPL
jgi:hypothetical protein